MTLRMQLPVACCAHLTPQSCSRVRLLDRCTQGARDLAGMETSGAFAFNFRNFAHVARLVNLP